MTTPPPNPSRSNIRTLLARMGWPPIIAATVLATLAAGAVLVLSGGSDDDAAAPTASTLDLRPADEVPAGDATDIVFTTSGGDDATLDDVVEGPAVVNFFASWCPPCVAEMPAFDEVARSMEGDVTFFGLAVTDRPEDAERIVEQTGITYRWGRDVRGDVAGAAGVVQMPTTLFIDADGEIVEVHGGALDADELHALITEHLGIS